MRRFAVVGGTTSLVLLGCAESLTPDPGSRLAVAPSPRQQLFSDSATDMPMIERFSIKFSASGGLRPGDPVTIALSVTANRATSAAEVSVFAPEVALSEQSGWKNTRPVQGQAIAPHYRATRSLLYAETAEITDKLTISKAGLYRVVARVVQRSKEPLTEDGVWINNAANAELWLFVDEAGGRVMSSLDVNSLPDSVVRAPGIRRLQGRLGRSKVGSLTPPPATVPPPSNLNARHRAKQSTAPAVALSEYEMTRYLIYFNYDIGAYAPVVGATVQWYIYDYYNNVVASYYGVTGADGGYPGPCVNYPNWYYANTMYWLENADVRVVSGGSSLIVSDCDTSTPSDYASTPHAWLFARYNEFIPFSRNLLNVSRALIPIAYDPNLNGAQYTSSNDQITFGPSTLYYQYGRFTVAHEYGHAIHEKALSGNAASGQCPVPHYLNGRYNLACALSEGFGDFVGATSQNVYDVGDYYLFIVDYTNHAWFSPGTDESIQEAAVAALFYDLTDSPGGDGGASEPWDQTLGERVSATIRDCRIRLPNAFVTRIRGVDDFVYCAERTIDASVKASYFQTRTSASRAQSITANASSSPYWPQSGVRAVWRMNLYGLN